MANSGSPTPTVEELNGTLVSKDISVKAKVRGADGATQREELCDDGAARGREERQRRTSGQVDHYGHKTCLTLEIWD